MNRTAFINHEIVICTHNRENLLFKTLKSLNQACNINDWSILITVIVNACNDGTETLLKKYQQEQNKEDLLPLRWFIEKKAGKSHALNKAISLIQSTMISFIDDDHRIPENYFIQVKFAYQNYPEADFFCGKILPDWTGREPAWIHDEGKYKIYPLPVPRFDIGDSPKELFAGGPIPGGGNLIVKKKIFDAVGGFSNSLGPVGHNLEGSEDYDWVTRALSMGFRLIYHPGIVQYHHVDLNRLTLKYLVEKSLLRSKTITRLRYNQEKKKFPKYIFRKIFSYCGSLICSLFSPEKKRFYLVRLSAAIGEFLGFFISKK